MADTDALLYLPGRDPGKLQAAVQIPALSPGWQQSFHDLLAGDKGGGPAARAGAASPAGLGRLPPAAGGQGGPESRAASSIYLAAADGARCPPPSPAST